jgi:hypothetical protein
MSKISYCSLEEAWGNSYKKPDEEVKKIEQTEKIKLIENNHAEYNKYRLNPINKVIDNNPPQYTPFNESIEKKYLMDKLNFLENEFRKYKDVFEQKNNNNNNVIENFANNDSDIQNEPRKNSNDIIDLCLLIIIGLILIFVMNSIFNIGKSIGARK